MSFSRRTFFSLLLGPIIQVEPVPVSVMEVFDIGKKSLAVLVHQDDPAGRDSFAAWLQSNPRSTVRVRTFDGEESSGKLFRVRLCFGRGLILLDKSLNVREQESLKIVDWKPSL